MQACWCFPVIGAVIGLLGSGFLYLLLAIHIPVPISAIITIGFFIILTGALHEDGLADTADGLGGGADKKSRIEKMRDSKIGSYGVLAIVLLTLIKVNAIITKASALIAGLIPNLTFEAITVVNVCSERILKTVVL